MESKNLIAILIVAVLLVGGYLLYTDLNKNSPIVSATGSYSMKVQPDQVSIYLNIEGRDKDAAVAKDIQSGKTDKVVQALKDIGLTNEDIQLVNYNIYPEYDWKTGRSEVKEYVASQQLYLKLDSFEQVADIVDLSVDAGALVSSINFELSDDKQNEYKKQVMTKAGEDAKTKAESIAAGQDLKLGKLVSIQPQDYYYPGPLMYYERSSMAGADVKSYAENISPRDLEISSSVVVQYRLSRF